ncbi:MAG TPA: hypothetical protein VKZ50_10185 [bacterium]|nr:hypothetical protein [bacterium]
MSASGPTAAPARRGPETYAVQGSRRSLDVAALDRWALMAVCVVGAMIPWYTLRLFPLLTIGNATINLVDALVGVAVLLALPRIVGAIRRRTPAALWITAFLVFMTVPFLMGMRDPDAAFYALREARGLAFYALALAFVAGGYHAEDYRAFAAAFVIGAAVSAAAVFAHVEGYLPIPGYPDELLKLQGWTGGVLLVKYLEWITPAVAFLLGLVGVLTARGRGAAAGWTLASFILAWYILATAERFIQGVAAFAAVMVVAVSGLRAIRLRPLAVVGAVCLIAAALALGSVTGGRWISRWASFGAMRWGLIASDGSLAFRVHEVAASIPLVKRNPVFGTGLGTRLPTGGPTPSEAQSAWHYVSAGYGYLLIRSGVTGLLLFLAMNAWALRVAWRRAHARPGGAGWPAATIGAMGLVTLLVANLLHPVVDIPEGVIAFSLFFGMIASVDDGRVAGATGRLPAAPARSMR